MAARYPWAIKAPPNWQCGQSLARMVTRKSSSAREPGARNGVNFMPGRLPRRATPLLWRCHKPPVSIRRNYRCSTASIRSETPLFKPGLNKEIRPVEHLGLESRRVLSKMIQCQFGKNRLNPSTNGWKFTDIIGEWGGVNLYEFVRNNRQPICMFSVTHRCLDGISRLVEPGLES